jgi:transposase
MSQHNLISIDLAKNVFQVCGMTDRQAVVFNRQLKRKDLVAFMINQAPVEVAMEACYSSHYWGRCFETMGHQVKLIPAQHVAPFVRGNKSDHNDAIAIGEAARRPNLIPVPIKTIEQSDIQCIHRMRERYVRDKTGLTNQPRAKRAVVISLVVAALPNEATAIFASNWYMAHALSYFEAKAKRTS